MSRLPLEPMPRTRPRPPRCPPPGTGGRGTARRCRKPAASGGLDPAASGGLDPAASGGGDPAATRRHRLRRARREVAAFPIANGHQARLQKVTLAMIGYMEDNWCGPGHEYDFHRWWRLITYYARVLASPEMAGRQACKTVRRVLDQDQLHPDEL